MLGVAEARALVGDVEHQPAVDAADGEADGAGAVAVRVVDEDVDDLADDLLGGARDRRARLDADAQGPGVGRQQPVPARLGRAESRAQIDAPVALRRVARDGQERLDRGLQAIDLRQRGRELRGAGVAQLERLELEAERGQRRAKLMRCRGGERPLALDEVAEPLRGGVQRGGDGVDLGHVGTAGARRR